MPKFEFNEAALNAVLPPSDLICAPGGNAINFLPIGKFYANLWHEGQFFKPHDCVLDIGCSVGRMAIPMTQLLLPTARYTGFDIVQSNIDWCQRAITPRYPHFTFHLLPVRSNYYPGGSLPASTAEFPVDEASIDFAWATSVFTHMGELSAFERYIKQLSRALRTGGRAFLTFFLKDNENPGARHSFPHHVDIGLHVTVPNMTDAVSSYELVLLRQMFEMNNLVIESITNGSWSGGVMEEPYQDLLLIRKF